MTHYIYLKYEGQFQKLARINRTATTITGSIWNIFPSQAHLGINDVHFTYPADGNYHFSIKMSDGTKIKVFSDRASRQKNGSAVWEKISKEEVATAMPMLTIIPGYKPLPIADYAITDEKFFPIITMGMGRIDIPVTGVPGKNDFIVDCENVDLTRTLNFALLIIGKNTDPYSTMKREFLGKRIFFNTYPKVWAGLFYGK